jgi:hypothetical protein
MWVLQMVVENQQLLRYLYLNIVMVVKKLTFIMRPICGYCNGCKKTNNYYETYMWVLQWLCKNQHLLRDIYVGIIMIVKNQPLLFSNRRKKKQKKKNHREEKKCREGRELSFELSLCPLTFGSPFCPPVSLSSFQALFSWHLFFLKQKKKKKNTKKKKAIEKNKKCKKGKELTFLISLLHLG